MSQDDDSKKFQNDMSFFMRNSTIIPPPPERCCECAELHVIADDLIYCADCHHPVDVKHTNEHSGIHKKPFLPPRTPTLIDRLWSKVVNG